MTRSRFSHHLIGLSTLVVVFLTQSTARADFEVPYLDNSNPIATAELRGVWMFNRGYVSSTYSGFEAYAAGYDATNGDTNSNGLFYYYTGTVWKRIATPFGATAGVPRPMFQANAVVGQNDAAEGNPWTMWVVGVNGRLARIRNLTTTPGDYATHTDNAFTEEPVRDGTDTGPQVTNETRDLYAVDTVQTFGGALLSGGQDGLVIRSSSSGYPNVRIVPTITNDGARTALVAGESITGIRFANLSVAYVVTSTFSGGDRYSTNGKTCAGSQTGRLYKVTTANMGQWQYLGSAPTCFYGLAIGFRPEDTADHGPARNVIWIATADGIRQYDELAASPVISAEQPGTDNQRYYAVTAVPERGGKDVNLLYNGGFENWANANSPDGWTPISPRNGRNHTTTYDAGVTCQSNIQDVKRITGNTGTYAVQVQPGITYSATNCDPATYMPQYTSMTVTTIELTTTEGQQFEITGEYKVDFPAPNPAFPAPKAQGGISVGCAGEFNHVEAGYVNCGLSNRSLIRTIGNPTSGWQQFRLVVSTANNQLNSPLLNWYGPTNSPRTELLPRRMVFEIRCEATYGARTACDNLKVKEITTPAMPNVDNATVIGVGANRTISFNKKALTTTTYSQDHQPAFSSSQDYLGVFGLSSQHVMTVGTATTLLSRTPSTLVGYIWAGTRDQASSSTAGLGYISASCINFRDANARTLCQQEQVSYGLQFTRNATTGQGDLTGRAWFGKNIGNIENTADAAITDDEIVSLGSCVRDDNLTDPTNLVGSGVYSSLYDIHGMCNQTARRCYASRAAAQSNGALSTYSCLNDFDCYGRCQLDEGRLCVKDSDCVLSGSSAGTFSLNTPLRRIPSENLKCGPNSPQSCVSGGWLSFDAEDFPGQSTDPRGGTLGVEFNTQNSSHNPNAASNLRGSHELSGFGRFMTQASAEDPNFINSGWVSLRGNPTTPTGKLFSCQDCYGSSLSNLNCAFCMDDERHSCTPAATAGQAAGQAQCHYICQNEPTRSCVNDNDCAAGDSCKPLGFCSGDSSISCSSDTDCGTAGGYCAIGAVCSVTNASCQQYGVNVSTETGQFSGFGWSEDYGWLDFRGVRQASARFFQTRLGDIYATGQIGSAQSTQPAGVNNCNATFLILSSNSIASNWCSALEGRVPGSISPKQSNITPIQLPSSANVYQNILGRFDVAGIETVTRTQAAKSYNKYGSEIVTISSAIPNSGPSVNDLSSALGNAIGATKPLGGRVFIVPATAGDGTGNFSVRSVLSFYDSLSIPTDGSGAGVLIVNGNLTLRSSLNYFTQSTNIDDLRKLQNLVVVVKGDLTIDNAVQSLVGSYYVTGTIHTASSTTGNNQFPLLVRGMMIAKNFDFGRRFAGTVENPAPSELIIADGRLQSNPMPGMIDFVKALPSISAQP